MRSIVRRDTGESYEDFLRAWSCCPYAGWRRRRGSKRRRAKTWRGWTRKRKKRTSNKEWKSPASHSVSSADGDARIAKMDTGAVVAVTLQGADRSTACSAL